MDSLLPQSAEAETIREILQKMADANLADTKLEWTLFVELLNEATSEAPHKLGKICKVIK